MLTFKNVCTVLILIVFEHLHHLIGQRQMVRLQFYFISEDPVGISEFILIHPDPVIAIHIAIEAG